MKNPVYRCLDCGDSWYIEAKFESALDNEDKTCEECGGLMEHVGFHEPM